MFIYLFSERERESGGGGGQKERERENTKQAPCFQGRTRHGAQSNKQLYHDLSWNQRVKRLTNWAIQASQLFCICIQKLILSMNLNSFFLILKYMSSSIFVLSKISNTRWILALIVDILGAPGWLSRLSIWLLILARVMILGSWSQSPCWAQCWV